MKTGSVRIAKLAAVLFAAVMMNGFADDEQRMVEEEITGTRTVTGVLNFDSIPMFGSRSDVARYVIKVPVGQKVVVTVTRGDGIVACDSLRFGVKVKDDVERHLGWGGSLSYVFTQDNLLTLLLEFPTHSEDLEFASVNYKVSFAYSDSTFAPGSFTGEKAVKFRSALLDSDGSLTGIKGAVAGILDLKTAKANMSKASSKATGSVRLLGGRRYSVSGLVPLSLTGPSQTELSVAKLGIFDATVTPVTVVGIIGKAYEIVPAPINCSKLTTTKFTLVNVDIPLPKGETLCRDLLPDGEKVSIVGKRWTTEKRTGFYFDKRQSKVTTAGTNPSSLKFTYVETTGLLSGSFSVYSVCNGRLVRRTAKIAGAVVNGIANCLITIKGVDWVGLALLDVRLSETEKVLSAESAW